MLGVCSKAALATALLAGWASAISLDIKDEKSIKDAAKTIASSAMTYYSERDSANIPGKMDNNFWEGSAIFSVMIQYWSLTGDDSNNDAISEGMYWMRGGDNNYMPKNYSYYLANDDQLTWGLAAMTAAEMNYPQKESMSSWVSLAENVWNSVSDRWDESSCDGGLRWMIWPYQAGYAMKNAVSNGGLFALSARLARYTNNETYSDWAEKIWDWSLDVPLLNEKKWEIADSTSCEKNCSDHSDLQWTFNYGMYMSGAAYMYNVTDGKSKWKTGLSGLLNTSSQFFPEKYGGNIVSEVTCEPRKLCDKDQILYKGLFIQDLSFIVQVAPYTESDILPLLQGSAVAAAKTCTGGKDNDLCSSTWTNPKYDGSKALEQQLTATSVLVANLIKFNPEGPVTKATAKNNNATSSTNGSPSTTSGGGTMTVTGTHSAGKGGDDNGAGMLVSGPVVLICAMVMGVLSIF